MDSSDTGRKGELVLETGLEEGRQIVRERNPSEVAPCESNLGVAFMAGRNIKRRQLGEEFHLGQVQLLVGSLLENTHWQSWLQVGT